MSAGIIVVIVVVVLLLLLVWKSFHSIGAAEVGLVTKRFAFRKLGEDNPIAFRGEAGYQADAADAGPALQALADVRRRRSSRGCRCPAGEIGVVIAQVGEPLPDRRQERGLQAGVRQLLEPRQPSSSTAARRACSARCCRRARSCPIHPVAFLVITAADGLRPAGVARARRRRPDERRAHARVVRADARAAARRGHRARRRRSTWSASSPRSRASRSRRATSPAGSAASTTSRRSRRRTRAGAPAPPTPSSSSCCSAARTTCTTTTRTSRRSSTPAARSACSTTRCSTAPTC